MKTRFRLLSYALLSIVLATVQSGVALSVNTGDANCGVTTTPAIFSMAIDPTNPSVLYIGTRERGLFKSVNEGQSWTPVGSVLAGYRQNCTRSGRESDSRLRSSMPELIRMGSIEARMAD